MASEGVLATLRAGWEAIQRVAAPKAVIGGLALSAWNHARYTRDADVLVEAGFHPRHAPPLRLIEGQGIIQFNFQPADALMPFQFDILLATTAFQRESLERAVSRTLPGSDTAVRIVRPDDLIVIKLLAGRIIDQADAAMVLRENREDIDFDRLHRVISTEGLATEYRAIWHDAYPDEQVPDLA